MGYHVYNIKIESDHITVCWFSGQEKKEDNREETCGLRWAFSRQEKMEHNREETCRLRWAERVYSLHVSIRV
jgi:hypothetical protein